MTKCCNFLNGFKCYQEHRREPNPLLRGGGSDRAHYSHFSRFLPQYRQFRHRRTGNFLAGSTFFSPTFVAYVTSLRLMYTWHSKVCKFRQTRNNGRFICKENKQKILLAVERYATTCSDTNPVNIYPKSSITILLLFTISACLQFNFNSSP